MRKMPWSLLTQEARATTSSREEEEAGDREPSREGEELGVEDRLLGWEEEEEAGKRAQAASTPHRHRTPI